MLLYVCPDLFQDYFTYKYCNILVILVVFYTKNDDYLFFLFTFSF